jgi:hypothetical protein
MNRSGVDNPVTRLRRSLSRAQDPRVTDLGCGLGGDDRRVGYVTAGDRHLGALIGSGPHLVMVTAAWPCHMPDSP